MLKHIPPIKYGLLLIDCVSVVLAAALTVNLFTYSDTTLAATDILWQQFWLLTILSILPLPVVYRAANLYKQYVYNKRTIQISNLLRANATIAIVVLCLLFLLGRVNYETLRYLGIHTLFLIVVSIFNRLALFRHSIFPRFKDTIFRRNVIVVGAGEAGQKFLSKILHKNLNLYVVGFLDDDPKKHGMKLLGKPVLGPISEIESIGKTHQFDEIVIAINSVSYEALIKILEKCKSTSRRVTVTSRHFEVVATEGSMQEYDVPAPTFETLSVPIYKDYVKKALDKIVALTIIILFSPIWITIAILIKLTSPGPVLFKARVIGKDGRPFTWYKFRTMYMHSDDDVHREHVADIIRNDKHGVKLDRDDRVTRVGRFLRQYSLDEFCQLINVLRGEMSLVGPRPCLPYEYRLYENWHKKRFKVTPGLTGLWQVFGRNKVTFNDMVAFDLYYSENYSLWMDLSILIDTSLVVLTGRGGR